MKKEGYENEFIMLNVIVPLIMGMLMYLAVSQEVVFIKLINELLGYSSNGGMIRKSVVVTESRYYLPDMLWGYSLIFALFFVCGKRQSTLPSIFILAGVFAAIMESLQLISAIPGSFDLMDIVVEIAACLLAVFIIKKQGTRGNENEN